jgi:hypothetical protein
MQPPPISYSIGPTLLLPALTVYAIAQSLTVIIVEVLILPIAVSKKLILWTRYLIEQ